MPRNMLLNQTITPTYAVLQNICQLMKNIRKGKLFIFSVEMGWEGKDFSLFLAYQFS